MPDERAHGRASFQVAITYATVSSARPYAMASTATASAPERTTTAEDAKGDVLVVFGITGDLAKVMTFRSLVRLRLLSRPNR
jgi:hypothetical protein